MSDTLQFYLMCHSFVLPHFNITVVSHADALKWSIIEQRYRNNFVYLTHGIRISLVQAISLFLILISFATIQKGKFRIWKLLLIMSPLLSRVHNPSHHPPQSLLPPKKGNCWNYDKCLQATLGCPEKCQFAANTVVSFSCYFLGMEHIHSHVQNVYITIYINLIFTKISNTIIIILPIKKTIYHGHVKQQENPA